MGKQRHKTIQIGILVCLLFTLSFMNIGCSVNQRTSHESYATTWVRKQITKNGLPKYPKEAKVVLSAPLKVSFPDLEAFRGYIISPDKQWDGIFFIHKKNHTVQFQEANQ